MILCGCVRVCVGVGILQISKYFIDSQTTSTEFRGTLVSVQSCQKRAQLLLVLLSHAVCKDVLGLIKLLTSI